MVPTDPTPRRAASAPAAPLLLLVLLAAGCATSPLPPVAVQRPERRVDWLTEVKPLLDRRCTVCHSCYNAPCQLKLDSYEGLDRGATKLPVYDGTRLRPLRPTRLFTDAQTTADWRKKKFSSVTASRAGAGFNDSILLQLLDHKRRHPRPTGSYFPEADGQTCPADGSELAGFLEKHPEDGMPYGFPALKPQELDLLAGWLAQGAPGPTAAEQAALEAPSPQAAVEIGKWEAFLNRDGPKHAVTARYLYEHLFLAHLTLPTPAREFYELVRSRTPPGAPIDLVATVRPSDDPGVPRVWYRLRKLHSTIVQKTHMVYALDDARLRRFQALFLEPEWTEPPHPVGYGRKERANPFKAFAQIPARSRYAFLLGEDRRLDPRKDSLEFIPGMIGSYPNMFFDVPQDDLDDLLRLLATFDGSPAHRAALARFAINRADDRFWETYDWFQARFDEDEPVKGGLLDLNRYYHRAH